MENLKSQPGPRSVALVALLIALSAGILIWAMQPKPGAEAKIVPLLIQVLPGKAGPAVSILNDSSGHFDVELYGGPASTSGIEEETPALRVQWSYRGSLSHFSLDQMLAKGVTTGTAAGIRLRPGSATALQPGRYVIAVAGVNSEGSPCAGAQSFRVGR